MQLISAQQAAANTLAAYIQSTLAAQGLNDVPCNTRWPQASKPMPPRVSETSPGRAVTVLLAGEQTRESVQPITINTATVPGSPNKLLYTIELFEVRQPMQIDVWTSADVVRDDLVARMDDMLNQGTSQLPGAFNSDPFGEGVSLVLGSAGNVPGQTWYGISMFWFDSFVVTDNPDAVTRSEYRSTARGEAQYVMTGNRVMDQLLGINLKLRVHEIGPAGSPPAGMLADIYKITNIGKGFVWSQGP